MSIDEQTSTAHNNDELMNALSPLKNDDQLVNVLLPPRTMVTVIRIFRRNFTVYGRLRQDTVWKRAIYRRNPGHRNMAPYTSPYLRRIRLYLYRILIKYGRKTPTWITVKYGAVYSPYLTVYGRIRAVLFDRGYT